MSDYRISTPAMTDPAATDTTSAWSLNALLRFIITRLGGTQQTQIWDGADVVPVDNNPFAGNENGLAVRPFPAGTSDLVSLEAAYTAAQTDAAIITVGVGVQIFVTEIQMTADNANSVDVGFRVGFGAATTPTTTGVVLTHPGVAAGSGLGRGTGAGLIGIGATGEDLRITSEVPTGGSIRICVTYYTV